MDDDLFEMADGVYWIIDGQICLIREGLIESHYDLIDLKIDQKLWYEIFD